MVADLPQGIYELPEMRDRLEVFRDRTHAGQVLADMLSAFDRESSIILAIPAGGVPVAAAIAKKHDLAFDVAVVSKITLPWNTEAGYGAIAFDGTLRLNEDMLIHIQLTDKEIQTGIEKTKAKVFERHARFRGAKPFPQLAQKKTVIVIDDGLASGFTMQVAVTALRKLGARFMSVAVPTGHRSAVDRIAKKVEALYCPNIRSGWRFAVADAYEKWSDVNDDEVIEIMNRF